MNDFFITFLVRWITGQNNPHGRLNWYCPPDCAQLRCPLRMVGEFPEVWKRLYRCYGRWYLKKVCWVSIVSHHVQKQPSSSYCQRCIWPASLMVIILSHSMPPMINVVATSRCLKPRLKAALFVAAHVHHPLSSFGGRLKIEDLWSLTLP